MILNDFSYFFNVRGKGGGLYSLDFEFIPEITENSNVETVKDVIKRDFVRIESFLDSYLLDKKIFEIEKEHSFTDTPGTISAGYVYEGKFIGKQKGTISDMLFAAIPSIAKYLDVTEDDLPGPFTSMSSEIGYSFSKSVQPFSSAAKITLKMKLGHKFNLLLLQEVLKLPDLTINSDSQKKIDYLLKLVSEYKTIDPVKLLNSDYF
ncbi:MAG: hypothetical protein HQK89_12010 [Nitrospirae bacterium]|nr:hypothetical protein [Nitrospirota bacterium]